VCHTRNYSCVRTSGYLQQWSASSTTVTQFTFNRYNLLNGHEPIDTNYLHARLQAPWHVNNHQISSRSSGTQPSWNTATRSHAGHVKESSHRHNQHNNCLGAPSLSHTKKERNFYPYYVQEFVLIVLRVDNQKHVSARRKCTRNHFHTT
jgi:hypothetical protein